THMEAIIIILLVVLAGFSFAIWKDGRSKDKEQPADNGLQQKVDSLQKKMDDSLVRIMFLEDKAKAASDKKEDKEVVKRPLNAESIRIALRYNGFSRMIYADKKDPDR
nr:hypothetical protein [Succinivibrionaceae bacterium]